MMLEWDKRSFCLTLWGISNIVYTGEIMKIEIGTKKALRFQSRGKELLKYAPLALCCLVLSLCVSALPACAMSAIISASNYTLDHFPQNGLSSAYAEYNDPWDYISFVMANSSEYTNEDGYGIVAYADGNPYLSPKRMWYKRVLESSDFGNVYYTGQYLQYSNQGAMWDFDILDSALFSLMNGENPSAIVMCHARNASGYTYGNHPFWFQYRGRTYTFMHNGNCNAARTFMINQIHEMNPDENWFVRYPSNYFRQTDPNLWVDTEVMFRYIMCYIVANQGDVLEGMGNALAGIREFTEDSRTGVYNFIMSDGDKLYAFRSTPLSGTNSGYRLSYKLFRDQFYGIRTQTPAEGDVELQPQELVIFSRNQNPCHYPHIALDYIASPLMWQSSTPKNKLENLAAGIFSSPNPFIGSTTLRIKIPSPARLMVQIYNTKGEAIWKTQTQVHASGIATVQWNGTDNSGRRVAAGVYFIRAIVGAEISSGRIILLK